MERCVVWVEGVDFDETVFDTQKLSVIRGASRALEEMPFVAHTHFNRAFGESRVHRITAGASQAGFIVDADAPTAQAKLDDLMKRLRTQGEEPEHVEPVARDRAALLENCAPFAHLKFQGVVEPIRPGEVDVDPALQRARARARVDQLRDPGVRTIFLPRAGVKDGPCEYDRVRPAEVELYGAPKANGQDSSLYYVSRASAARWHFGRALRQRLYDALTGAALLDEYAFADDFHELTATERPKSRGEKLPIAVARKIAVFAADGDSFTKLRNDLNAALGHEVGLTALTIALEDRMRALLAHLVRKLLAMEDAPGAEDAAAARFFSGDDPARSTRQQRELRITKLLRFETLLLGGDDITFVAPAWLGWWLALEFFEFTSGWAVGPKDVLKAFAHCGKTPPPQLDDLGIPMPMYFSAGLVFCKRKTPIRAAKKLAEDLCHAAKNLKKVPGVKPEFAGGLEIEVLESVEPPFDGLGGLRDRLLGKNWREGEADGAPSRLTLPRGSIRETYQKLRELWISDKNPFPASQAFRALRAAVDAREPGFGGACELSSKEADAAADGALGEYFSGAGGAFRPSPFKLLPRAAGCDKTALNLYFALQMRDYVKAAGTWTDKAAGL
ncbi:MAG: hypothetical protein ACLPN5_18890 [Roseiarcus sp.]